MTERPVHAITISDHEADMLAQGHPDLPPGHRTFITLDTNLDDAAIVAATLNQLLNQAETDQLGPTIDQLQTSDGELTDAAVRQIHRNLAARTALRREFGLPTANELAQPATLPAPVDELEQGGRIFSVTIDGTKHYPGYQFRPDGTPHPTIAPLSVKVQ